MIPPIPSVSDSSSWEWMKENTNGRSKSREGEYCRQHEQFPSTWCSEQINSAFVRPWELNPVGHVANLRLNKRMTGFGKRAAPDSHVYIWLWLRQDRSTEKPLHLSSCLWIPLILTFHLYYQNCWNKISAGTVDGWTNVSRRLSTQLRAQLWNCYCQWVRGSNLALENYCLLFDSLLLHGVSVTVTNIIRKSWEHWWEVGFSYNKRDLTYYFIIVQTF